MPRVPDLVPRRRSPGPPVVLRAVRASRRRRQHGARGGPRRMGGEDPAFGVHQGAGARGPPGEVLPGVRGGAVPVARIRSGVRPRRRRDGGDLAARRGAARVRAGRPGFPRAHRIADVGRGRERPVVRGGRGAGRPADGPLEPPAADRRRDHDRARVRHGHRGDPATAERGSRGGLPRRRRQAPQAPGGRSPATRRPEHRHPDAVVRRAPRAASPRARGRAPPGQDPVGRRWTVVRHVRPARGRR